MYKYKNMNKFKRVIMKNIINKLQKQISLLMVLMLILKRVKLLLIMIKNPSSFVKVFYL